MPVAPPPAAPPYAIAPTTFRFPALAALAGRAPLGGRREVALAVYLAARLVEDTLPAREIAQPARGVRASFAKQWLSTLSLPAGVRQAIATVIEASASDPAAAARSLRGAMTVVGELLDKPSRAELLKLVVALDPR